MFCLPTLLGGCPSLSSFCPPFADAAGPPPACSTRSAREISGDGARHNRTCAHGAAAKGDSSQLRCCEPDSGGRARCTLPRHLITASSVVRLRALLSQRHSCRCDCGCRPPCGWTPADAVAVVVRQVIHVIDPSGSSPELLRFANRALDAALALTDVQLKQESTVRGRGSSPTLVHVCIARVVVSAAAFSCLVAVSPPPPLRLFFPCQ